MGGGVFVNLVSKALAHLEMSPVGISRFPASPQRPCLSAIAMQLCCNASSLELLIILEATCAFLAISSQNAVACNLCPVRDSKK